MRNITAVACLVFSATMALAVDIVAGTYKATFPDGCAYLTIAPEGNRYTFHQGCTKAVSYEARVVKVSGTTVRVDDARLKLTSVGADRLVGDWSLGDFRAEMVFLRD